MWIRLPLRTRRRHSNRDTDPWWRRRRRHRRQRPLQGPPRPAATPNTLPAPMLRQVIGQASRHHEGKSAVGVDSPADRGQAAPIHHRHPTHGRLNTRAETASFAAYAVTLGVSVDALTKAPSHRRGGHPHGRRGSRLVADASNHISPVREREFERSHEASPAGLARRSRRPAIGRELHRPLKRGDDDRRTLPC